MGIVELLKTLGVSDTDITRIVQFAQTQVVRSAIQTQDTPAAGGYNTAEVQKQLETLKDKGDLPSDSSILIQQKALDSVTNGLVAEMLTEMAQRILINSGIPPIQAGNIVNIESKIKLSRKQDKGDLDKLNQTEKLFAETVKYISKNIFVLDPTASMEDIENILATDEIQSIVNPESSVKLLDDFSRLTSRAITNKENDLSSGYIVDVDKGVYLTEGSKQSLFLETAGQVYADDPTYFFQKYAEDPEWRNGFLTYWPDIATTARLDELAKENPKYSLGLGDILQGIANDEAKFSWVGTILGPEAGSQYATTYPMSKDDYSIFRSRIPFQDYEDFLTKATSYSESFKAVEDILDKQFQVDSSYITESDKANLAQRFRNNAPNITFAQFAQNGGQVGNIVFGVDDFMETLYPDIVAKKEKENIINNQTGYKEAFNKFINPNNDNFNQVIKGLDAFNPGQAKILQQDFNEALSNVLRESPVGTDLDTATQKILETMGITPQGDLKPLPRYYGQLPGKFEEKVPATYITPEQDVQNKKPIQNVYKPTYSPSEIIGQQFGITPPTPSGDLLGSAPGLPAFLVVPEPVYTDQNILQIIANRYYDRPELVQFLQTQIPDIAQRFRLSQKPGALDQESFGDFEYYTDTITAGPGGFVQGIKDKETGEPNVIAPGTEINIQKSKVVNEFGEAIDDPISSSAAYSYFERDRPKTIADFIGSEAAGYESAFKQSPLFTKEQERLERESQIENERQRQERRKKLISQPVAIFGRRQR